MHQLSKFKKTEFGKIPLEWKTVSLGNIASVHGRIGWKGLKRKEYAEKGPLMLSVWSLVDNGPYGVDFSSGVNRLSIFRYDESPEIKLQNGDVLLAKDGDIGRVGYIKSLPESSTVNSHVVVIRTMNNEIYSEFLYWYMKSHAFQAYCKSLTTGTTVPLLSQSNIRQSSIPIPPLREQMKIASILSNVAELLQKTDQIIKQTQRLKKGLTQRLLTKGIGHTKFKKEKFYDKLLEIPEGWYISKLGEQAVKIGSGITPRGGSKVYQKSGIPLIRSQNVHFDGLRLDDVAFITEEIDEEMKNSRTQINDVLLNITGASVGRCTYIPPVLKRANVNQHVCIIRPGKNIDSKYLSSYLSSNIGQSIIRRSYHGLSREGLTFSQIASFLILTPPIQEQITISAFFTGMNSRILKEVEIKSTLDKLKKGLMQKLLTGKIRVNV